MSLFDNVRDAFRLASWRAPVGRDAGISPFAMVGLFATVVLAGGVSEWLLADGGVERFNPYGLNSMIASVSLNAAVILGFARSSAALRNLMLLYVVSAIAVLVECAVVSFVAPDYPRDASGTPAALALGFFALAWFIWFAIGARRAFKSVPGVRRPTLRGFAFALALVISALALPNWPIFAPKHFDVATANLWEMIGRRHDSQSARSEAEQQAARRDAEMRAARLEARQGALVDAAVAGLEPRDPAVANVFTIGVAGWSDQDVFMRETRQSLAILKSRFHLGRRDLALVNNEATADELPMASMQNLAAALRAVGSRMDREKDLLILAMTSHGSKDGFALSYDDFVGRALDPKTLKLLLDEAGIKNRVLIVSSCYSGTFIAPLADPNTLILTAASSTRTSFGCSDDREWTWFGEAFFAKGLADNATLVGAFASAKSTIETWERDQKITPSDPQIFIGDQIARQFPDLVGEAPLAAARESEAEPARVGDE